jgi:hypothetical protein
MITKDTSIVRGPGDGSIRANSLITTPVACSYLPTKEVGMRLAERSSEVHLTVSDAVRGFDIEAAKQGEGLAVCAQDFRRGRNLSDSASGFNSI